MAGGSLSKEITHTLARVSIIRYGVWKGNPLEDLLALDDAFAVLAINLGLALLEAVQRIDLAGNAKDEAHGPEAGSVLLQRLGSMPLANARSITHRQGIKGEVPCIANLSADSGVAQKGLDGLCVGGLGGGLEVLDVLADAHDLAGEAELLLDGVPGGHLRGGAVCAEEVPGVEAGEVLDRAEDLVAADGGGDEAQVMGHRGVVGEGVGDHV